MCPPHYRFVKTTDIKFGHTSACIALLAMVAVGASAQQPKGTTKSKKETAKKAAEALSPRIQEFVALRDRANTITTKIGEVASSGKLTTSDDAVAALKGLVQELSDVNAQLKKMQEEIDGIKGWIEGQNESLPVINSDIEQLKRFKNGSYLQFQYTDGQNNSGTPRPNDGFNLRRSRFSHTGTIDSKTSYKLSVDFSSGSQRIGAELKDAQIKYDIQPSTDRVGTELLIGQQPMPLGYELERSSSEREFPERAAYNQRLFSGERGRGAYIKHGISQNLYVHAGLWNSLTYNDPQQIEANTFRNLSGTRMAGHIGIKYANEKAEVGVSGFVGYRNSISFSPATGTTITTQDGQRQFIFLDGAWIPNPKWAVRGEMMFGKDRVPQFTGSGGSRTTALGFDTVRGNHLQVSYSPNYRNTISVRSEFFDPNTKANDNIFGYGLAWSYNLNPGTKLTFAHEVFKEQGFDITNNQTTIRLQVKF